MMDIVGILLAAGASRRFGRPKLVEPLPDGTPIAIAAAQSLRAVVPHCIAVVRDAHDTLSDGLRRTGFEVVICGEADRGLGASLSCGVRATREARGWMVALADMPFVSVATLRAIAPRMSEHKIIAPSYGGQRGHPVGFGRCFEEELLALHEDRGGREILSRHADALELIPCNDAGVLRDIDRVEDLRQEAQER